MGHYRTKASSFWRRGGLQRSDSSKIPRDGKNDERISKNKTNEEVRASHATEVNSFDPFTILNIDTTADSRSIKKAFREQSLRWHPDKNPNNPQAEAMFMMINKAYEALTDATACGNWEKYGNPDGRQSLEVSIGLPSFLLEASNRNLVLLTYLICMVVLVPICVWK